MTNTDPVNPPAEEEPAGGTGPYDPPDPDPTTDCAATDPALTGPYDPANGVDANGDPVNGFGRTEAMNTPEALAAEAELAS